MHREDGLRDELRSLPSIVGRAPAFEVNAAPPEPRGLFLDWLRHAIDAKVPEPHAATLSTIGEDGMPDARVLIIKDIGDDGSFRISTGEESAKGRQLLRHPGCSLSFYWGPLARAVRVRGIAQRASAEESAADFRARHGDAKAIALAGRQSSVLDSNAAFDTLVSREAAALAADETLTSARWAVWSIKPASIEFWQGDPSRNHQRLRYVRRGSGWQKEQLWP